MSPVDIVVICVVGVAVIAATGYLVYRKIKGKGGCTDCGCKSCSRCRKKK